MRFLSAASSTRHAITTFFPTLIGALLGKRLDGFEAACLGALAHVLAARAAAARFGADHVMAGDVIDALPQGLTLR